MTDIAADTRPAPLSRVWSGTKIIADDLQGDDLTDVLQLHSDACAWWLLSRSDYASRTLHEVAAQLELDAFAIHDLTAEDHRVKFEQLQQARIVVSNVLELDADRGTVTEHPLSIVVTDRAVICSTDDFDGYRPAPVLAKRQEWLGPGGVEAALQVLLGVAIGNYEQIVTWLENSSDELADALFQGRPLNRDEQLWAFRLRTILSHVRRVTDPMRTVLAELADSLPEPKTSRAAGSKRRTELARHWRLLQERHTRVANAADALREALGSVFDTSLGLADLRLNSVMKKLSGWAAIIAVPTLVTGFVGMNVKFPLESSPFGFWFYLVLMLLSAGALYAVFKRLEWI